MITFLPVGASLIGMQALPHVSVPLVNAVDIMTSINSQQQMLAKPLPMVPLAAHSLLQSDDPREQASAAQRQPQANLLAQLAGQRRPANAQHQGEGNVVEADRQNTHSNQSLGSHHARHMEQGNAGQSGLFV